jgi:hypothetical protein
MGHDFFAMSDARDFMVIKNMTIEYWYDAGLYTGKLMNMPGIYSQAQTLDALGDNIIKAYQHLMPDDFADDYDVFYREIQS